MLAKALEGLSIASASDLQKILRVNTYSIQATAMHHLMEVLPVFRNRMGAMLFLISALLSRGLVCMILHNLFFTECLFAAYHSIICITPRPFSPECIFPHTVASYSSRINYKTNTLCILGGQNLDN